MRDSFRYGCAGWLMLMLPVTAAGVYSDNSLIDVRVGPHKRFDRVVFEFQREPARRIVSLSPQTLEVRFSDVVRRPGLSLPTMPAGLRILRSVEMYEDGHDGLVFRLQLLRDASPSELILPGQPWRLAVDVAARMVESRDEKPEYIPGDRPIPTMFAETAGAESDSFDPVRARAILAFYHAARGDTEQARREAVLYQQLTGCTLALGPAFAGAGPDTLSVTPPVQQAREFRFFGFLSEHLAWVLIAAGLFVKGFVLGVLFGRWKKAPQLRHWRKWKWKGKPRIPETVHELADELERGLQDLQAAVKHEPTRAPSAEPSLKPEEESSASSAVPEPVAVPEEEIRESLTDRRVRRVLDLAREGRSVAEIAQELEMGQDEVKLVLDLNP